MLAGLWRVGPHISPQHVVTVHWHWQVALRDYPLSVMLHLSMN